MKIAVIGGGASGIAAAITAARQGAYVTLYEQSDRIGKKILASGNGRCNLSHKNMSGKFYNAPEYVDGIYKLVPPSEINEFFKSIGIITYADGEGRIYPVTDQSSTILDCLRNELNRLKVRIVTDSPQKVTDYLPLVIEYDFVILASGGIAGKNGAYNNPLKELGHTATEVYPSLVPLVTDKKWLKAMNGVRVDAKLTIADHRSPSTVHQEKGEVLFRDYGISGIAVFNISAYMARHAGESGRYGGVIKMELLPNIKKSDLIILLADRLKNLTENSEEFFTGLLNKNLSAIICDELGLTHRRISENDIELIAELMKGIYINVYKPKEFLYAQVMAGGIRLTEMDTVRSRLNDKLFVTGEALNVDGLCGGYNLHFAWASGILAGKLCTS